MTTCLVCQNEDGTRRVHTAIAVCRSGICGVLTAPGMGVALLPGGSPGAGGQIVEAPARQMFIPVQTRHIGGHCMECHEGQN